MKPPRQPDPPTDFEHFAAVVVHGPELLVGLWMGLSLFVSSFSTVSRWVHQSGPVLAARHALGAVAAGMVSALILGALALGSLFLINEVLVLARLWYRLARRFHRAAERPPAPKPRPDRAHEFF